MKENYILGLDLGVGSVGWSCMKVNSDSEPCRLIAANSYIFPSEQGSLEDRRNARSVRRLIRRRKGRVQKVKSLFITYDYMKKEDVKEFYNGAVNQYENPYILKVKGLNEALTIEELFICLIHYAKYRGFKSNRKIKENAKNTASATEDQKMLYSINLTQKALDDGNFTISQYIISDPKFKDKIKNSDGDYHIGITREMILEEAGLLLEKQVSLGLISDEFKQEFLETISFQRSFSQGPNEPSPYAHPLKKMVGKCKFDHEFRAPITAPSYEKFILLQKLQNVRYHVPHSREYHELTQEQIHEILEIAMSGKEIKYKDIAKVIGTDVEFKGLVLMRKEYANVQEESKKHPDKDINELRNDQKMKQSLYQMKSTKYLKGDLKKLGYETVDIKILDEIADLLSKYKSDDEILMNIDGYENLLNQSKEFKKAILNLDESKFKAFGKLSFSILYKLLPLMLEQNLGYSDAMSSIGIDHSKRKSNEIFYDQLPPLAIAFDELDLSITNRCAIATLQETKRIVNAIIRRYGKPIAIHVEVARELTKDPRERLQIIDQQINNKINKMNLKLQIMNKYPFVFNDISKIHHDDIVKYRLYMEQGGLDPYTLAVTGSEEKAKIHEKNLFSEDYEVDHILPYSKSFNDTMSNKVLVNAKMNREKADHVPFDIFKNQPGFSKYLNWVNNIRDFKKKTYLLTAKMSDDMVDDFSARALNDTRYATKVLCDILRYYFSDVKIRSFTGQVTAKLKGVWGLNGYTHSYNSLNYRKSENEDRELLNLQKELSSLASDDITNKEKIVALKKEILKREKENDKKDRDNHLHHALDATVIACATDSLRRRVEIHEQKLRQEKQNVVNFRVPKINRTTGEFIEFENKQIISLDYATYYDLTKNENPKHFPVPYPEFHDEIILRIYERNEEILKQKLCAFNNYNRDDIKHVHSLTITHKCDRKETGRMHKATIYGLAVDPENKEQKVLTNRIKINAEAFDNKKLEKIYDKDKTQKEVYESVKLWMNGYKNGQEAFKAHNYQFPIQRNGNRVQKVKLNFETPKEEICIHEDKKQFVEKENVVQIFVYKRKDSDKLYFVGMDRYRVMNLKKDPDILIWWGQAKNFKKMKFSELSKNGFILYKKLYKNQAIEVELKNGAKGICMVGGFASGMFEIKSLLGDSSDLLYSKLQTKVKNQQQLTISTIQDIQLVNIDILGNIS